MYKIQDYFAFMIIKNNFRQNVQMNYDIIKRVIYMKKFKEIMNVIYSLAIVAILFFLIYLLIKNIGILLIKGVEKISSITSSMDSVVIVAIITGGISIVTVVISSIVSKFIEYKQITKRYLYEKREEPYKDFVSMVYKLQKSTKNAQEEYTQDQMVKDIAAFSESLTLWGSSRVIKKWIKFREFSQDKEKATQNLFLLEEIVFEIRRDMGQGKKGLKQGDLLSFFVNDIKKYLPNSNKQYK